jgi:hypothetical protein
MRFALIAFLAAAAHAQLPPSGDLSPSDRPLFHAEVDRVGKMLAASPDNCWIMNEMARTWASARQYPETMQWLSRIADLGVGLDPSRDPLYKDLHGTREFEEVLRRTRAATGPVSTSREAFRITEADLVPESSAYDPEGRHFYFGSMRKGVILRCDSAGRCSRFAEGLGSVLGVKAAAGLLWVVSNHGDDSALVAMSLRSGRVEGRYTVPGQGHQLNDIALTANGDVFATDTPAGMVWSLKKGGNQLEPFLPDRKFQFANGIAVAPGGTLLFVSNFPDGITVVDLRTGDSQPLMHRPGTCLALVDGLYFYRQSLVAIQNASMAPRVVRFFLSADLRRIERMEVLERGNRLFEGITGGTIAGNEFYFPANIQDEKPQGSKFDPIVVLKSPL